MVQLETDLTAEEKQYLIRLLDARLGETRVEVHRTHTPDFREQVQQEEALVRGLLAKLK
jgi:hypothetical protein